MGESDSARIPLQISRGCVIASIQVDLSPEVLRLFREELLELLHTTEASGVILDVSGIAVMDHQEFEALRRTMAMARLMGVESVVAGLRAGVVSALVELGVETDDIVAALDLDDAFEVMEGLQASSLEALEEENDAEQIFVAPADTV
jgi:rsbT antagonist protein RsbS